jgi:hypothetical protein
VCASGGVLSMYECTQREPDQELHSQGPHRIHPRTVTHIHMHIPHMETSTCLVYIRIHTYTYTYTHRHTHRDTHRQDARETTTFSAVAKLQVEHKRLASSLEALVRETKMVVNAHLEECMQQLSTTTSATVQRLEQLLDITLGNTVPAKRTAGPSRKTFCPRESHITVMLYEENFRTIFNIGGHCVTHSVCAFVMSVSIDSMYNKVLVPPCNLCFSSDGIDPIWNEHCCERLL